MSISSQTGLTASVVTNKYYMKINMGWEIRVGSTQNDSKDGETVQFPKVHTSSR